MNEDLGDSLDSVEALIKKHEDFEKSLAAQEEKIKVKRISICSLIVMVFIYLYILHLCYFLGSG